ncbi:MAG: dihydrolipoyl dehydrogenase [Bacteriovoracia bacterium]
MSEKNYDVVIVGGGPGGYVAALRAAQLGFKTACIEKRKELGGTCLNIGCIPSKALLESSEHYYQAKNKLSKHGLILEGVSFDLKAILARKDKVVSQLVNGVAGLFKKAKVDHIQGLGKLLSPGKLEVSLNSGGKETILAKHIVLASGSEPVELSFAKFDGKRIISSTEALSLDKVPEKMVVIGGGAIGLEMGSVWSRLGAKVTVIEYQDRLVPSADRQVTSELLKILTRQGMEFKLSTKVLSVKASSSKAVVEFETVADAKKDSIEADVVLVSVGRRPNSEGLGLQEAGVVQDKQGRVVIDDKFRTNIPNVYAIGDLVRGAMLAHKAEDEGVAVAEIIAGQHPHINYDAIPNIVYTWPELASVGWSEDDCKAKGVSFKVGTFPFIANGRAKTMEEVEGLVKIIADAKTDRVLGVHIVGARASDMIAEAVLVMEFGGSSEDIARSSHAHPTLAEIVKEAALAVEKRQIHL